MHHSQKLELSSESFYTDNWSLLQTEKSSILVWISGFRRNIPAFLQSFKLFRPSPFQKNLRRMGFGNCNCKLVMRMIGLTILFYRSIQTELNRRSQQYVGRSSKIFFGLLRSSIANYCHFNLNSLFLMSKNGIHRHSPNLSIIWFSDGSAILLKDFWMEHTKVSLIRRRSFFLQV